MKLQPFSVRAFAFVAGLAVLAFSGWANADPPSRVARLGYMSGAVSFSPAGEDDWLYATINRPLGTGDRLWADAGSRGEIQVGGAVIRMNAATGVSVLNLDDEIAQLQLTQGTLNVRVRRLEPGQVFEVDTPNLAFTLRQPGEYRIEVDPDGNATTIIVRKGQGEVYGEGAAYVIDAQQPYRFMGTGLREYEYVAAPRLDEFDRWSSDRDRSYDNSASARYVSRDVIGYEDLDANGTWRDDPSYGSVWIPSRVAAGWAPYRDGHWVWVDPWGWTWVDDAPWGFAVSHYGRWTNMHGTWGWVPGPVRTRAYYAPALVVFAGGDNFRLTISSGNVGAVAWFPLGPREVYRPSYPVSRSYFENINHSNTVINNTVINNYYNNTNVTNVVYVNRQVPGAVVAVPRTAFVQSQRVSGAAVQVSKDMAVGGPVAFAPPVAPTEKSVRGAAAQGGRPPGRMFERPVVARAAPPAASVGFAAQQQQLAAKPGRPLDDAARRELKPAVAAPAPVVKVIAQKQAAPPTVRPPPAASGTRQDDARGKSDERKATATPAQAAPPASAAQPPGEVARPDARARGDQRAQPVAPPPLASPQGAAPAATAAPQTAARAAPPPDQRGTAEQGGRGEPRIRPTAPSPPPQGAAQTQVARPQVTQPAASGEPRGTSEQRGNGDQRGQPGAPTQRTVEPRGVPSEVVHGAPTVQQPAQRARSEPEPAARQAQPHPAVAAHKPPPAPTAKPRDQEPKPAADKRGESKKDGEEQNREEENRKQ